MTKSKKIGFFGRIWWSLFRHPNMETRWRWDMNVAQIDKDYDNVSDRFHNYGVAGGEIWSEQVGFIQMDWGRGVMVWKTLKHTGNYWHGSKPGEEGQELSKDEYDAYIKKYKYLYDT
jgi:hypothetical protein